MRQKSSGGWWGQRWGIGGGELVSSQGLENDTRLDLFASVPFARLCDGAVGPSAWSAIRPRCRADPRAPCRNEVEELRGWLENSLAVSAFTLGSSLAAFTSLAMAFAACMPIGPSISGGKVGGLLQLLLLSLLRHQTRREPTKEMAKVNTYYGDKLTQTRRRTQDPTWHKTRRG